MYCQSSGEHISGTDKRISIMRFDFLIVGAGLYGAVFAREAMRCGKSCLVIDKRKHRGGNVYCEKIEGINVHKYGAHIFHTSDKKIWDYVNEIVPFNRYTNCPVAQAPDGRLYNLPFNMNTFYQMWGVKTPAEADAKLKEQRTEALKALGGRAPDNLQEQALILIGRDIYEQLIKGYTEKQWGRKCTELPPDIIRRLPVRLVFDNNYFNDAYQGIPIGGYNKLIDGLLEGADVRLNCDFLDHREELEGMAERIVYTGAIDRFFDYKLGRLEYRTVRFETEVKDMPNFQGNAVVNYTSRDVPYTRIIEHKHFESFGAEVYENQKTVVSKEYSTEWTPELEPYYPVNDERNTSLYEAYKELSDLLPKMDDGTPKYIFGGRLADYRYYDMAPTIAAALKYFE